jgi:hypothetical protein
MRGETMGAIDIEFSDDEESIVIYLAELRESSVEDCFMCEAIAEKLGLPEPVVEATFVRLMNYGFIEFEADGGSVISVRRTIFEVRDLIQNPPLANHWKNLLDWWFSKAWTLPVTALFVVLPLIAQWVEMLKTVLGWVAPFDR